MERSQVRHFTKVYNKPRKPLGYNPFKAALDDTIKFAEAIEDVVVADVRFALTGEETPHPTASDNQQESK
jgi:hypothetical protein